MPFFHRFPLVVNIQRKRTGYSLTTHQFRTAGYDKSESRNSLDTFIGTADQEVDSQLTNIHRDTSKAAHSIYNQFLAMHLHYMCQLLQRIQDTGSRFTVNEGHMSNI